MSNSYTITVSKSTLTIEPGKSGSASFTVTNKTGKAMTVRAEAVFVGQGEPSWLTIDGEEIRNFSADGTQQYLVKISVPANAANGTYPFKLRVYSVDEPDEYFAESSVVEVTVPQVQASEPAKKPNLIAIAAVVASILLAVVAIWLGVENIQSRETLPEKEREIELLKDEKAQLISEKGQLEETLAEKEGKIKNLEAEKASYSEDLNKFARCAECAVDITVESIERIAKLATIQYHGMTYVHYNSGIKKTKVWKIKYRHEFVVIVKGIIEGKVDLKKAVTRIEKGDNGGGQVFIRFGECSVEVDPIRLYEGEKGRDFIKIADAPSGIPDKYKYTQQLVRDQEIIAEKKAKESAIENGIVTQTRDEAVKVITEFVGSLGWSADITFDDNAFCDK